MDVLCGSETFELLAPLQRFFKCLPLSRPCTYNGDIADPALLEPEITTVLSLNGERDEHLARGKLHKPFKSSAGSAPRRFYKHSDLRVMRFPGQAGFR